MGCESSTAAKAGSPEAIAAAGGPKVGVQHGESYDDASQSGGTGMSAADLERLQKEKGPALTLEEVIAESTVLFKRIDVDGSNGLDKDEFVALASKNTSLNKKRAEKMRKDQDEAAEKLMRECDVNQDGNVSCDEWCGMFEKSYHRDGPYIAKEMLEWFTMLADIEEMERKEAKAAAS